jgi:hypothetical protein
MASGKVNDSFGGYFGLGIRNGNDHFDKIFYNIGIMDDAMMSYGEIVNEVVTHDPGPTTSIFLKEAATAQPELQLYPNPGNPYIYINCHVPAGYSGKTARVEVYDMLGRLVWRENSTVSGASHRVIWKGTDIGGRAVASGRYIAQVDLGGKTLMQNFALAR